MKIKLAFNSESIKSAVAQLNKIKKTTLPNMRTYFLTRCCEDIRDKANRNLDLSGLGESVIAEIKGQWNILVSGHTAVLRNGEGRGYMVEFGVGTIGQDYPHPNAFITDYQYNVPTQYKDRYGQWRFTIDDIDNVDLSVGFYTTKAVENEGKEMLKVKTKGSPAIMFLYNALIDFKTEKRYKELWIETKKKYIK